ncbi:YrhK family protein [Alteriqipengyuania lutimaris]|uniref:YrhK domain-containing protein n=1 Tax=Alteriqipengyuania lutimaris TaxID=1538146 RepID=A0A395LJS1_9SPHN|nr:YrhK family protein [Alteriqipengyuania lutimaris]MBB3034113.1 hypothetical protein [Alteriqipengyuania lutimaris]RDS76955.1 hypothetical protein DL238_04580 [Alteriqipengyuania lutimaris]
MNGTLRLIVKDFGWIHNSLGLLGNVLFFVGSILFLPAFESHQTLGVWLFIMGSFLMLVGALGELGVKIVDSRE